MLARYLVGATAARTGDEAAAPALLLLGLAATGSGRLAALLYASLTVTSVAGGPLLGVVLDRTRRPGPVLAGLLAAYAAGLAAVAYLLGRVPAPAVLAVAAVTGLCAPALTGAWTSRLGDVLPPAALPRGHALDAATYNLAGLAGPALAGLLAGVAGAGWTAAAVVALLLAAVPAAATLPAADARWVGARQPSTHTGRRAQTQRAPGVRRVAASVAGDLRAGAGAVVRSPGLRRVTAASCLAYAGSAILVVTCPALGERHLGGTARGPLLLTVLAGAALLATLVLARRPLTVRPDTVYAWAVALAGLGLLALAAASTPAGSAPAVVAAVALVGLADGPLLASMFAVRQRDAPPRLRAQVFTTAASLKIGVGTAGAVVAGLLADRPPAAALLVAAAAHAAALVVFAALGPARTAARGGVPRGTPPRPRAPARDASTRAPHPRRSSGVAGADRGTSPTPRGS